MPPSVVKTVRDLIYWEYAKLISGSAVGDRKNYGFIMHTFMKLKEGNLSPSDILRENKMLVKDEKHCAYCGTSTEKLEWEHIIPHSKGGPDSIDNLVLACRNCNLKKGDKDPYEYYGLDHKYELPRIVLGKYLKLVYDECKKKNLLDFTDLNGDGKLDVLDLSTVFQN